jgi:Flp pilus assembly protein TadG
MTRSGSQRKKGQALLFTTLSLTLLCGMLGLAIDLGWGRYTQRVTQTAADAAALAAASKALQDIGQSGTAQCGITVRCQDLTACPGTGNLQAGCLYAQQNGMSQGGANGHQTLQLAAGTSSTAPNVPNVPGLLYWTQAVATQSTPQLFSGVLGNPILKTTGRATAAIYPASVTPSLYLLNRSSDCFVSALGIGLVCGEDFLSALGSVVNARGGIYMSSANPQGTPLPQVAAATIVGTAQINSPFTYIMGNGGINTLGLSSWNSAPQNGFPDSDYFRDPMRGKGQPPAPTGLADHPVPGGIITGNLISNLLGGVPTVLPPGNYYATNPLTGAPLGTPVTVTGNVTFGDNSNPPCGGFCNYVFYGGLVTGALSTTTFSPGRYVFAGAQPVAGGPAVGLMIGANSTVKDLTPMVNNSITRNTDAGEIFIFTDKNYPGLQVPLSIQNSGLTFPQVTAGFQGGLGYTAVLHGLNASNNAVPSSLKNFAPVLLWQDQANTTLKYTPDGSLDISCGSICSNILSVPGSQEMILQGSQSGGHAGVNLYGTIYSPRAAWITELGLLPNDTIAGPLQIIAGALQMAVFTKLDVTPVPSPLTRMTVSLIE